MDCILRISGFVIIIIFFIDFLIFFIGYMFFFRIIQNFCVYMGKVCFILCDVIQLFFYYYNEVRMD